MTKQRERFGLKQWAEVATILIAVLALATSIWSANESRKHNRLSFKPHLSLASAFTNTQAQNGVYLDSNGPGPALIKSFKVFIGENQLNTKSPTEFGNEIRERLNLQDLFIYIEVPRKGDVLKPGESHRIMGTVKLPSNLTESQLLRLKAGLPRLEFVIEFESVYEELFVLKRKGLKVGVQGL